MYATVTPGSDKIRITIGGVGFSVDYYCDYLTSAGILQRNSANLTSGSPVTLVDPPAASQTNQMQALSVFIVSAGTGTVSVTIDYYDGVSPYEIFVITMPANYTLTYTADGAGWQVYDQNGHGI